MITLIRPILLNFIVSRRVKELLVELLEALAKKTENKLDDVVVAQVRSALLWAKAQPG